MHKDVQLAERHGDEEGVLPKRSASKTLPALFEVENRFILFSLLTMKSRQFLTVGQFYNHQERENYLYHIQIAEAHP